MPDAWYWSPTDDEAGMMQLAILGLLSADNLRLWSDDVVAAICVLLGQAKTAHLLAEARPDVRAQVDAFASTFISQLTSASLRRAPLSRLAQFYAVASHAARHEAVRQRDRAARSTGRSVALQSVVDGCQWKGKRSGRPDHANASGLLLRVEVWRDVRLYIRSSDPRFSRTEALAELLLYELQRSPATKSEAARLDGWIKENRRPPARGLDLVRAITNKEERLSPRAAKLFGELQPRFSELRRTYATPSHIARMRARRATQVFSGLTFFDRSAAHAAG